MHVWLKLRSGSGFDNLTVPKGQRKAHSGEAKFKKAI